MSEETTTSFPEDEMNPKQPDQPQVIAHDAQAQQALTYLHPVLQTVFNGVMVSSSQWCPPDKMLATLCYAFGVVVGNTTSSGGLSMALRMRSVCRDAFDKGMRSVTPQMPAPPPNVAGLNGGTAFRPALMKGQIKR